MGELMTGERSEVLKGVFNQYDRQGRGELSPLEVQHLHADIRMGGISYPQVHYISLPAFVFSYVNFLINLTCFQSPLSACQIVYGQTPALTHECSPGPMLL